MLTNKNIELYLLIMIISINIVINGFKKNFSNILVLLISTTTLFLLTNDIKTTLLLSMCCFIIFKYSNSHYMEGYKNSNENILASINGKTKNKKTKKHKKKLKKDKTDKHYKDNKENKENYIDVGTNFIKAYENLTPQQIDGMTKDTQSLIGTQKKLMSTLNNLGPTLTEGKKILDTFKNYFDDTELLK